MNDNDAPLSTFTSPDRDRYFEDYVAGAVYILGEVHIDRDEMVAYSRKYDPQDMHINEEKAVQGPFNGLIANGFYTASLMMRFLARNYLSNASSLGSPDIPGIGAVGPSVTSSM